MYLAYHAMHPEWQKQLKKEFQLDYMQALDVFLETEKAVGKEIYPAKDNIFNAFKESSPSEIKVVLVGQDPYHNPGQAHGLSFSVPEGVKTPPSLRNIFKELKNDLNIDSKKTDLSSWQKQGVLLLNSILTVEKNKPGSHQKKGWEEFTNKVLSIVNENSKHCVFILWGSYAQKKGKFLDEKNHLVIRSPHPSPLSSYRGFFGSKPFSKTNKFLKNNNLHEIHW